MMHNILIKNFWMDVQHNMSVLALFNSNTQRVKKLFPALKHYFNIYALCPFNFTSLRVFASSAGDPVRCPVMICSAV